MKIIVQAGQTLFDIALEYLGGIDGVFDIAAANGISDITGDLVPGTELIVDVNKMINADVVAYYANNKIVPVSGSGVGESDFNGDFNQDFN